MLNKEKLNANAVGVVAHSDLQTNKTTKFDCRGGRLCPPANKQNGITLIALIITIIVMLILVGVTVTVALKGGLFESANESTRQKEEKTIYEQIVGAMKLKDTGKTDVTGTYNAAKTDLELQGKTVTPTSPAESEITDATASITFEVKGKNGTYTYTITTEEIKIGGGSSPEVPDELATYILGADGKGRKLFVEQDANEGIISMSSFTFQQDKTNPSSTLYKNVKFGYGFGEDDFDETTGNMFIYIRYGKEVYKLTVAIDPGPTDSESDDVYMSKKLDHLYAPTDHSGEYVKYGGIDYIVMSEDKTNGTVDLISAEALQVNDDDVSLGYNDSGAKTAIPASDETNPTTEEQGARGVWSYNNAVNTLVTACKDATGLTVDGTNVISIRSVGNTNVKYTSTGIVGSDSGTYTYDWQTAGAESDWYTTYGFNMKPEDTNHRADVDKMKQLGIFATDNLGNYWLASRGAKASSSDVDFFVRCVYGLGYLRDLNVCWVLSSGNTDGHGNSFAVRPVVTLNSSLLWE